MGSSYEHLLSVLFEAGTWTPKEYSEDSGPNFKDQGQVTCFQPRD